MMTPRLLNTSRLTGGRSLCYIGRAWLLLGAAALFTLVGCAGSDELDDSPNQAASTFSGPRYLRGTVGSYGSFVNKDPRYIGGYGMVVDLNATGSNEVPGFLREWLTTEMLRNNLGSVQFGTERFSPERVMADLGSSVVAVEGLVPPGAMRGSKFDLLVTMIDQTSTSLAGGRLLWQTQLSPLGLDRRLIYTETIGAGYGQVFINPLNSGADANPEFMRQAVIVNGGTVTESQKVQFVLNQPSYRIANLIADRINARFEATDTDNLPTAVAKSDGLINIHVPARFASQPDELLALIEHLYLDPSPGFVRPQAEDLGQALTQAPAERARPVALAWKGLGPNVAPVLRGYYEHPDLRVRFAALEAGAWLQDTKVIAPLKQLATQGEPDERVRAARALVVMTRSNDARRVVRGMLNDPDPDVRIGAYEALALVSDRAIQRLSVHDGRVHKFFIDRVPSKYPTVFALQGKELAIVIFGGDIPLRKKVFSVIDKTLVLRTLSTESIPVGINDRYEGDSAFVPIHRCGALEQIPSLTPVSTKDGATPPPPDWRIEIGDKDGNTMLINIRDDKLKDAFGLKMLRDPSRGKATPEPRAIAMVRVVKAPGKDEAGSPTPAVGELLALREPDAPLPVALRYQPPGEREARLYRVTPTVATLAYTLGFKQDNLNTQFGPDLTFSQVVGALHKLCEQDQIPAPFKVRLNPLAERISAAQKQNQAETRPEITPEELQKLQEQGASPAPPSEGTKPASEADSAAEAAK